VLVEHAADRGRGTVDQLGDLPERAAGAVFGEDKGVTSPLVV